MERRHSSKSMNRCPRHPLVDHFLSPAVVTFLVRGISVLACGTRLTQATILLRLPRSGRMADYPRSEFLSRPVKEKAITSKDELRRYLEAWASSEVIIVIARAEKLWRCS